MVRKMLLSLCVLSSAWPVNDLSSVFILKPLKIFGLPKSFEAFKSKKNPSRNDSLDLAQALYNKTKRQLTTQMFIIL